MTAAVLTTERVRTTWDAIAPGFDRVVTAMNTRHGGDAIRRVDVGPGTTFLDVGAGSGALSIPAARRGATLHTEVNIGLGRA